MKLYCISDTHTFHRQLQLPNNIDVLIHAGDVSNVKDVYRNEAEVLDFIEWYGNLPISYKIMIAGNHDGSIERKLVTREFIESKGIIYLEHESVEIEGFKIFGSPYSPTFFDWYFMKARDKLSRYWDEIPEDTDILITHTPPKGILDLSYDRDGKLEYCGCSALMKKVMKVQPKFHIFGHIHDCEGVRNQGIRSFQGCQTIFINASCVTDGKFNKGLTSFGESLNLYEWTKK